MPFLYGNGSFSLEGTLADVTMYGSDGRPQDGGLPGKSPPSRRQTWRVITNQD